MEYQKLLKKKTKAIDDRDEPALCLACTNLADYHIKNGNHSGAFEEYKILAQIYKKQNKMIDYATVNRGIAETYISSKNYEKAIKHLQIYLNVSRQLENKIEEQRALASLGHTYLTKFLEENRDRNDLNLAKKYSTDSLGVIERLTNVKKYELADMSARIYNNLGLINEHQGNHGKGIELLNKAIILCKANDIFESLHFAYSSLASLLERRGEYNKAIHNYRLAIATAKKLKNKAVEISDDLNSIANIYLKLGDIQAAKKYVHKAYKLKLPVNLKEEITRRLKSVVKLYRTEKELVSKTGTESRLQELYEIMGDCLSNLNCYGQAIDYYLKMLEIAERTGKDLASCHYSLAETYRDNQNFDKAIEHFEKEFQLQDFKKGLDTLCEIIDTKESKGCSPSEVIEVYKRAISICKKEKNQREEGRMLDRLVNYLRRTDTLILYSEYEKQLELIGFDPSDSEDSQPTAITNDDVSLSNLTDDSEDSDLDSPTKRRKTFKVNRNLKGETPLHTACINGKINVVKHYLDMGHPVNVRDNSGWLPLHDSCIAGHFEIVKMLLDKGAAVNDRGGVDCNGVTPLHDAAAGGHLELIEYLLDRGASALAKTDEGETPYHYLRKYCLENAFEGEKKLLCDKLLERMGAILDTAGQSREIDVAKQSSAFVSSNNCNDNKKSRNRRSDPKTTAEILSFSPVRKMRESNISNSSSSEEDNDIIVQDEKTRNISKSNAANEYKMAIEGVRRKICEEIGSNNTVKRSAFVNFDEEVEDDWLEDDLGDMRKMKKRKISYTDGFINSSNTKSSALSRSPNKTSFKRHNSTETVSSKGSCSSGRSSRKSNHGNNGRSPVKKMRRSGSNETLSSKKSDELQLSSFVAIRDDSEDEFVFTTEDNRNKQQMSLLDAGFVRCTSQSQMSQRRNFTAKKRNNIQPKITHYGTPEVQEIIPNDVSNVIATTKFKQTSPNNNNKSVMDEDPIIALDVNIEGRPFRVTTRMSLKNELTVKWLSLEAARRYAKKEYVEPVLELTTKSGAELVDDDVIGTLFITDNPIVEVCAKVLKWNLPPIQERYKEACSDMSSSYLDLIVQKLNAMTISLDVKNAGLRPEFLAPLCKSLLRENRILDLDLSNNFLTLDCVKLLTASLPTLENLNRLNLSCTNLHSPELRALSAMFVNSPVDILTKLYSLDLSQNFFGDECLPDLASITRHLNLREFDASVLNFTRELFAHAYNRDERFGFERLERLNLGGNGLRDVSKFLTRVDPGKLSVLDVFDNGASGEGGFTRSVIDALSKREVEVRLNMERLNLSRCGSDDSEVYDLLRICDNLETIDLSYTKVTSLTLRRLLESPAVKKIRLIGCENIEKYFDDAENLWTLPDHRKSLEITCEQTKFHILIRLWKSKYPDVIVETFGDLLILR